MYLFVIFGTDIESVFKKSNVSGSNAGVYALLAGCFNVFFLLFFFFRARLGFIIITGGRTTVSLQIKGIDRVKRQGAGSMGEGGGDQEE